MHDVAIVGAGPVGVVAALELIRRGADVVVLERRVEPTSHSRSIGIHPPALDVLERLGCAVALIGAGLPIRGGEVLCDGAVLGTLSFRSLSARHPYILSVPQHVTERVLRARLADLAPDALVTGREVTATEAIDDGVRLQTVQGSVEARWAIGADGPHSTVRASGGFRMRTAVYPDRYVMGDAADGAAFGAGAMLYLERGGVVESFPLPSGLRRWVVHRGSDAEPLDAEAFARVVRQRTGTALDARSIVATSAFGVRHVWTAETARGRVILAGDAAHEVSPIGGQGMTLGWLDAVELAEVLAAVLGGARGNAIADYQRAASRRQRIVARQAFFNTAMGRPRRGAALAVRNLLVRGVAQPVFERRLARAFTMAAPAGIVGLDGALRG